MPIFRGNVGNLLQHWVFCEALEVFRGSADQIDFIDAYSMAPLADERPKLSILPRKRVAEWADSTYILAIASSMV